MKVTIYDVAKKAGVSIATVSKILNNTGRISNKTRQLVMNVMKDLDYQPSMVASALASNSTLTIGVLIPDLSNPYFASLTRSMEDRAHNLGFNIMICSTDYDPDKEAKYISLFRQKSVDGIILVSGFEQYKIVEDLVRVGMPVAVVAREFPSIEIDTVSMDNFLGGYKAARHLIDLGHSRIQVIARNVWTNRERIRGIRQALEDVGLTLEQDIEYTGSSSLEAGKAFAQQLLDSSNRPTAIIACNDSLAMGVIISANEKGIKIPDELSVIGFDNTAWSKISSPPLTTIAQPLEEIGYTAMDLLVQEIRQQKQNKQRVILVPKLIVRGSTAKCP